MKNLIYLRGKKGLTQKQLAEKTNLSRTTIGTLENGVSKNISAKTIKSLCDVLECCPIELFGVEELVNTSVVDLDSKDSINHLVELLKEIN